MHENVVALLFQMIEDNAHFDASSLEPCASEAAEANERAMPAQSNLRVCDAMVDISWFCCKG